jgi:glycosyltransferase involved in cell wall biosynthesis
VKVLLSAYACEPGRGSEPGVGWGVACMVAQRHEVWVLTHTTHRPAIEAALKEAPNPNLHFVYSDFPSWPSWVRWWENDEKGIRLHYYLWQLGAYPLMRRLHRDIRFDLTHHVTYAKYWAPSLLAFLPAPFVWGPVGGGDATPKAFLSDLSRFGQRYERARELARWLGERDPLVRWTARGSVRALASTRETAKRIALLRGRTIEVQQQVGLSEAEIAALSEAPCSEAPDDAPPLRFISMGGLLHWKGFHLGLRAFSAAALADSEYWIVGDGPERRDLEKLASDLGIASRVTFWGALDRTTALDKLKHCHILVHPSLHDSGGMVVTEAMAAGKPVVCLDLGGPAVQVTEETGVKVAATDPNQTVRALAEAFQRLARDEGLRQKMGESGRRRVLEEYSWPRKGERLERLYQDVVKEHREHT